VERDGFSLSLHHVSIQAENNHPHTRKEALVRQQICQSLDLGFLCPQNHEEYISVV
jgi:hypothetical protein